VLLLVLLFVAGCSGKKDDPETAARKKIARTNIEGLKGQCEIYFDNNEKPPIAFSSW